MYKVRSHELKDEITLMAVTGTLRGPEINNLDKKNETSITAETETIFDSYFIKPEIVKMIPPLFHSSAPTSLSLSLSNAHKHTDAPFLGIVLFHSPSLQITDKLTSNFLQFSPLYLLLTA